ncbi:MAG: radical SAM protein [Anaerolineales bacterium]|nr:radical SAM protein [Anaerolineales bacterium]MCK5635696.1 radical SAM protein [Anaerolineales bacterium]
MDSIISRFFTPKELPSAPNPGIYQYMFPEDVEAPNRLHLRVESDGTGVLLVNATIVLHLNQTAAEHVALWIQGKGEEEAARIMAARYKLGRKRALQDQRELREEIFTLATEPDLDPIMFLGMNRVDPYSIVPSAPYRLDLALTYKLDKQGTHDPLARERVDRELSKGEWVQILSTAWDANIPHVTFTGGEPTLRDDLPDLIQSAETLGMVTGIITDGKRLSDPVYLDRLDKSGLDHILLTFTYDDPAARQGLERALETDIFVAVHLTLDPSASVQVIDVLKELSRMGVKAVSLSVSEKTDQNVSSLEHAREKAASLGLDLVWDLPVPYSESNPIAVEVENVPQGAGRAWLYVEPDGDVLPTQGVNQILGNILRDPWNQVWDQAVANYRAVS